jgi:thioredoxin-like negative regulator of GroEL
MIVSRHVLSLLVLAAVCAPVVEAHAADRVMWFRDLQQASDAARKADLPMVIDFWADWCAPCNTMDAEVYTNPNVVAAFDHKVIGVRIHFDLQREVARKFNVWGLPHLVFTNSYGTPLISHRGFMGAEQLVNVVNAMPPLAEINSLDRRLQKEQNSAQVLDAMGRALRSAGFFAVSNQYYDRALKQGGARIDPALRESILYETALNALDLKDSRQAAKLLEECVKRFPNSARKPEVLLALSRAYAGSGMTDRAKRALGVIVNEYPQSAAAADARARLESP